ncbi:MAG: TrkH family potassium uptake protein [Acetobacteraceae bacterium]|nr:MAG: TrkH family potassium uptake protein [Acetobacteraceae bacterium]
MLARLAELPLLVVLLGLCGAISLIPALYALGADDHEHARDFLYAALILLVVAVMLGIATAAYVPRDPARSHLAALVVAYGVLPFALSLPLIESLPDTSLLNAWFEMVSSFTTTGATVYLPERLADSIHLWRATVGWFGGFLTLLAAYAILAPLNLGGTEVSSGRTPGRGGIGSAQSGRSADPAQRLTRFALLLFPVYAALTVLLWCGLMILGAPGITGLIHAMGTLSTSGISGSTPFQASPSGVMGEVLIFLCFAFAITRRALPNIRLAENRRPLFRDPELRLAGLIVLVVTLILFLRHWLVADPSSPSTALSTGALSALWGILFTTASFLNTFECFNIEDLFSVNTSDSYGSRSYRTLSSSDPDTNDWRLSNALAYSNQTDYSTILYHQNPPSGLPQEKGQNALRLLEVYAGKGCEQANTHSDTIHPILGWSCSSSRAGDCYDVGYNIMSFKIGPAIVNSRPQGCCTPSTGMGAKRLGSSKFAAIAGVTVTFMAAFLS